MKFLNPYIPITFTANTPNNYPLYNNKDEALFYLKLLTDKNFLYTNHLNYDAINYEHLLYIEEVFGEDDEIFSLIKQIKLDIVENYIFKQKYLHRLSSNIIDLDKNRREQNIGEIHLPNEWLNEFRIDVEEEYSNEAI